MENGQYPLAEENEDLPGPSKRPRKGSGTTFDADVQESDDVNRSSMEPPLSPVCQLCSQPYNDPRILPCLHSFCLQCIHDDVSENGNNQIIVCPSCQQKTPVPQGGVTCIPCNPHLTYEVEIAGYVSKFGDHCSIPCGHCIDGRHGPAVKFCCTCHQFICKLCHDYHMSGQDTSKHDIVDLSKESAKKLPNLMKPTECRCFQHSHEGNRLSIYCETCKKLICPQCIIVIHKGHQFVEVSTMAIAHRDEMKEALEHAQETMRNVCDAVDENDKIRQEVELSKKNAAKTIEEAFTVLQKALDERKKTLLIELEYMALSKTTDLDLQKEVFELCIEGINRYIEATQRAIQTHTDHDILAVGQLLITELHAVTRKAQSISFTPAQASHIHAHVQVKGLVNELAMFGSISELSPSPSESTWTCMSEVKLKKRFELKVETKTSNGSMYPYGNVKVSTWLNSKVVSGSAVFGKVDNHNDGTFTITFTPETAGLHELHITMNGQHIKNSPTDIAVTSNYNYQLSTPQQVGSCNVPLCVAIHDNGDIYVGSKDGCIYVFDQLGNQKNTIGSQGSGQGQFDRPCGIFIKGDVMYIADTGNHRIQKIATTGEFLQMYGENGSGQGQLHKPTAVIVDSKQCFIVSYFGNHRIQMLNQNFDWLLTIGGSCMQRQSFKSPRHLALDSDGSIYVAAQGSNAIKVFSSEGNYIQQYEGLKGPTGIAIDDQGYLFVTERHSLTILYPHGSMAHKVGNLNLPFDVVLDHRGGVYVVDKDGNKVLKYSLL